MFGVEFFDQALGVFFVNQAFEVFDVLFVLRNALAQGLNVACEHGGFTDALRLEVLAALDCLLQVFLQAHLSLQVLALHVSKLRFYNLDLLFVLQTSLPKPIRELLSLGCV